jgi:hypothetical protein
MVNLMGFDASKVEPNEPASAVPKGEYQVIIVESEQKSTSKGDGWLISMVLQIVEGPFKNRKLYDRLNIGNKNEKAVTIARGTLSAICRAVNVLNPKDSEELHNRTLTAVVEVKEYQGKLQNEVKGYKSKQTGVVPPVTVTATASPDGFSGQTSKPNPFPFA